MSIIEKQNEENKKLGGFPNRENDKQTKSAFKENPNKDQPGREPEEEKEEAGKDENTGQPEEETKTKEK